MLESIYGNIIWENHGISSTISYWVCLQNGECRMADWIRPWAETTWSKVGALHSCGTIYCSNSQSGAQHFSSTSEQSWGCGSEKWHPWPPSSPAHRAAAHRCGAVSVGGWQPAPLVAPATGKVGFTIFSQQEIGKLLEKKMLPVSLSYLLRYSQPTSQPLALVIT